MKFSLYVTLFCCLLCQVNDYAQTGFYDPDRLFSKSELLEDLQVLDYNLQVVHPGLFTYMTPDRWADLLRERKHRIKHQMTELFFTN